jgi:hypothetical protein
MGYTRTVRRCAVHGAAPGAVGVGAAERVHIVVNASSKSAGIAFRPWVRTRVGVLTLLSIVGQSRVTRERNCKRDLGHGG